MTEPPAAVVAVIGDGTPGTPPKPVPADAPTDPAFDPTASTARGADAGILVDPEVSRIKFEEQVAAFRAMDGEYIRRGWFMLRSEYPEIVVAFAAPHLKPRAVIAAVLLDFTNYDYWAPSVTFVDPFTLEPLHVSQMPFLLYKQPATPQPPVANVLGQNIEQGAPQSVPNGNGQQAVGGQLIIQVPPMPQPLVIAHEDGNPFLCVAGVREYHDHPFHTDNPWLAHRGTTRGTLLHILNVIHTYGIAPLKAFKVAINIEVGAPIQDMNNVPA